MIENTDRAIKSGQSRETANIEYTRKTNTKQKQHNMCWTSLYTNKLKKNK